MINDISKFITDTPPGKLLLIIGAVFVLIGVVTKIGGLVEIQQHHQKYSIIIGSILLGLGLIFLVFQIPPTKPKPILVADTSKYPNQPYGKAGGQQPKPIPVADTSKYPNQSTKAVINNQTQKEIKAIINRFLKAWREKDVEQIGRAHV